MELKDKMNWNLSTYENIETVNQSGLCEIIQYNLEGDNIDDHAYSVLLECNHSGDVCEIACRNHNVAKNLFNAILDS